MARRRDIILDLPPEAAAAIARLGIHYVALKLEGDLRDMRELISTARRA
jgi:hypothetical protein